MRVTRVCLSLTVQNNPSGSSGKEQFMVSSVMTNHPDPAAVKQPQTITLPLPCLTVGMMLFL